MSIGVLAVPLPKLEYKAVGGGHAALEDTITVRLGAVRFPDGAAVGPADVRKAFGLILRWNGPAASPEVWNAKAKAWQSASSADAYDVAGLPLSANDSAPTEWQGFLVPIGGKDAWGNPQFVAAVSNYPQYRVRAAFTAQVQTSEFRGLSADSAPVEFISTAANTRFGVALTPSSPLEATHVRMFIKNAAQQVTAIIEMDASGRLTLGNLSASGSALATVALQSSGDITLTPASGQRVTIEGDLDVGRVTYLPAGGGAKKMLV